MKKMMKRLLAALLAASIGLSACVQALAAPGNSPVQISQVISGEGFREKMMKEQEEARRKNSPLYAELLRTNGEPQPITSVLDEGRTGRKNTGSRRRSRASTCCWIR